MARDRKDPWRCKPGFETKQSSSYTHTKTKTKTMAAQATQARLRVLHSLLSISNDAKHQQQTTRVKWVPGNNPCLLVCRAPIDTKHRCTLEQNGAKGNFLISCLLVCLTEAIYVEIHFRANRRDLPAVFLFGRQMPCYM